MNPSTACAEVVVDELVRLGVTDVVLAPGSRSAPLAYALHAADAAGRVRLHVRIDERSAAFLALGLAKLTGRPAPVVTTSGTAVANLFPAVMEAHESGVPMLLLTADRPHELRGTRANQTTDQLHVFRGFVRWFHDLGVPEARVGAVRAWRTVMDRAMAAATGATSGDPGPVHLDLPLRDPLVPDVPARPAGGSPLWPESLEGRADGGPWTRVLPRQVYDGDPAAEAAALPLVERTLVILGDGPSDLLDAAAEWARAWGFPVIGEPFGRWGRGRLAHGVRVAAEVAGRAELCPERVVVVGRLTLSRSMAGLLRLPEVEVCAVTPDHRWADPGHVVHEVHPPTVLAARPDPTGEGARTSTFLDAWREACREAGRVLRVEAEWPSGAALAHELLSALPDDALLFTGSSNGVRHLELVRGLDGPDAAEVVGSRGLAGIDGCVSTAAGLALATTRPTYALLGDVTFLHDANGLVIGPDEPRPDLTIVVGNDDGGAIFATLEYGAAEQRRARPGVLERVFSTPTGVDIEALARAHGVRHVRADSPQALRKTVSMPPSGLTLVEVRLQRP